MGLQLGELVVEVGVGAAVAKRSEDVVGRFACLAEPRELGAEHGCVERGRHHRSDRANSVASSIVGLPPALMTPVRNPIEERCPSPIPRTLITNRRLPATVPVWSG